MGFPAVASGPHPADACGRAQQWILRSPYREGEGEGQGGGDDGGPAGGAIAPPAPLVAPALSTHWSVEPAGLACSHAVMVAKMQLTLPDALLRQKGASPIGVCAAAIMGAATSSAAASMDVIRKRPLRALRNGSPLSAEQIIASMVPAAGRRGGKAASECAGPRSRPPTGVIIVAAIRDRRHAMEPRPRIEPIRPCPRLTDGSPRVASSGAKCVRALHGFEDRTPWQ